MPQEPSHLQYFHLRKPIPAKQLRRVAYQKASVDHRGFVPFDEPKKTAAQITGDHIPGAVLRVPGQHPTDTRWGCVDPEFALHLELRDDDAWSQGEMKAVDDPDVSKVKVIEHNEPSN